MSITKYSLFDIFRNHFNKETFDNNLQRLNLFASKNNIPKIIGFVTLPISSPKPFHALLRIITGTWYFMVDQNSRTPNNINRKLTGDNPFLYSK